MEDLCLNLSSTVADDVSWSWWHRLILPGTYSRLSKHKKDFLLTKFLYYSGASSCFSSAERHQGQAGIFKVHFVPLIPPRDFQCADSETRWPRLNKEIPDCSKRLKRDRFCLCVFHKSGLLDDSLPRHWVLSEKWWLFDNVERPRYHMEGIYTHDWRKHTQSMPFISINFFILNMFFVNSV